MHRCDNDWQKLSKGDEPRPYWEWEPDECNLEPITPERMCKVMEHRKGILLVGELFL